MAVFAALLHPSDEAPLNGTVNATSSSAEILIGANRIIAFNSDKNICIRFGNTGMGASSSAYFRIPAGTTVEYDMGSQLSYVRLYNLDAATANYYIQFLSKN